jgi:hypothetical protein
MNAHNLAWQRKAAVEAGRTWLAEIDDTERVLIDGQLVTAADQDALTHPVLDYLLAEPPDPPEHVEYAGASR